jgi:hypothetical protein
MTFLIILFLFLRLSLYNRRLASAIGEVGFGLAEENISTLNVSVHDVHFVEGVQSVHHFNEHSPDLTFPKE